MRSLTLPSAWRAKAAGRGWASEKLALTTFLSLLLVFLVLAARLIDVGAADLGVAALFSTDEKLAGQLVLAMVRNGNLGLSHFFSYGPLELYAARALLWPYALLRPVDDEAILVALRAVSLAAGAGCLCVTYLLGRRLWGAWTGALAAAILVASLTSLAWSTTAHPDMLQLLWLLLGLWIAAALAGRPPYDGLRGTGLLAIGSVCAALAFATKYSGEVLLPILWLASALGRMQSESQRLRSRLRPLIVAIGLSCAVFMASFLLLDPSAALEWRRLIYQMSVEARLAHAGRQLLTASDPGGWLRLLGAVDFLGPVGLVCGLSGLTVGLVAGARALVRQPTVLEHAGRLPLLIFTAGYLSFLLIWVGDRQDRYALPVLPGLALTAAAAICWLAERSRLWTAIALGTLLLTLLPLGNSLVAYERDQAGRMRRPGVQDRIEAGRWLTAHLSPAAPILADAYTYVPPAFTNVSESYGLTHAQIESDRPRVIVTDVAIRSRFSDPGLAAQYVDGTAAYLEIANTYQELEAGRMPCYPLLQRFGPTTIYGQPAGC